MSRKSQIWQFFDLRVATLVAATLLCVSFLVEAASAQINAGRRLALVVGNTSYDNVTRLKNAVRDADAVSESLERLGFEVLLLKDARSGDIERAIEEISAKADDAEATLFYFSGHGFQMGGANYLVPVDAGMRDRSKIREETVRLDGIIASLQGKSRQTLIFLDACRNDPLPASVQRQASGRGLAQVQTGKGTFVAFATQPGNVTADGVGDRSPFTNAFVEHVETPGISISDMMIRIRNTVEENTLQRQTPWDQSSLRSQFYFNPAEEEQEELSEETLELLASLDPKLRKKFAEQFGIKLPEEDNVPEEAAGPRLSIAPVTVDIENKATVEEQAETEVAEPSRPAAPRLALAPALNAGQTTSSSENENTDLGESGKVEVAQPRFRPSDVEEEQQVAILLPQDRQPIRTPVEVETSSTSVRQAPTSNRIKSATASEASRAKSPERPGSRAPSIARDTPSVARDADSNNGDVGEQVAALRPLDGAALPNAAQSVTRSLPSSGGAVTGVEVILAPVTTSSTRIVGEDITKPEPKEQEKSPIKLAALDPKEVKPQDTTAPVQPQGDLPENLPLAIQGELYRLGCYRNSRDGIWGNNSAKALLRYYLLKKESPDLVEPDARLFAKLSAEETVICKRTERAKPRRKKKDSVKTARVRPSSKKPVKSRTRKRAAPRKATRKKSAGRKTARKPSGGSKRIKKIKKLGGAFR